MLWRACLFLLFIGGGLGLTGVDLTLPYSKEEWVALQKLQKVDFVVTRLLDEFGVIDQVGISTLATAFEAGIYDLSGYIYPCISSSTFGTSQGLNCSSPERQVSDLLKTMASSGLAFKALDTKSFYPTGQPTRQPSTQPTSQPSVPTGQPTRQPSRQPTRQPSRQPTGHPTAYTTFGSAPTYKPIAQPTKKPTAEPSAQPTVMPTPSPTPMPTAIPSRTPTTDPTPAALAPTEKPTARPTAVPTRVPTAAPTSATPTTNPTIAPTARPTFVNGTDNKVLNIRRFFLMVEDDSPNRYFSVDNRVNQRYLVELAYACWLRGIQLGIYTTLFYWNNIMTLPFDGKNPTADRFISGLSRDHLPLWVPRFDKTPGNMDFFVPFGGWKQVYMKQYTGGSAEARRAGSWRINKNYINATGEWDAYIDTVIPP